ncbi:AAA family ATPase [Aphanizomenon flos-aquae NRERC-008]|jgi:DNA sulfur modification protein DndD|uniref:Nuclease SbcCD subunit C n=1 Tax=Aphanizomenon flos-aquae FACHB-1249 TaxID=2692889 RepID=A0ABR8IMQ0_APHFL|nr:MULTISPECIES: AAA family ATPase [Aphanizomenon]MBD1218421.1 AAA family ATPase [Aphanizomenon flos-aquae Clear-A1]MCE2907084.1 AAA family ATPase [Anabaena sp. CoA2_C59]MDJ0504655.1 AAA family ATPase [Nostocales cyanobacterium LE14-WE12]MBD2391211.1 AAA family ATPase [Aphanizomenon flos-aquae FACHB-1171]MBD2558174.1 AAA family ATPase [Aphanizomenon flos-aquae FACHB-1290]
MKLTSIKLCNFRSFYGKTPEVTLAGGNIRNTTMIYGSNGAGKTSILNAFTWVLYEKFSAAFASTEQLVNKRAIAESEPGQPVECWVEVGWEHEGNRYRATRGCRVYKNESDVIEAGKTQLKIQVAGDDGKWYFPIQQAEEIITQILPLSLHQYFFFDGERIEEIVRSNNKAEISEAIRTFLGVEVIELSIKHLKDAKKSLETDLKHIGDPETKQLLTKQEKQELEIENINKRQTEINQELEYQQTFKKEISNKLRELSAVKELQERKQSLESQKNSLLQELKKTKENLKKVISARGYTVLLSETTAKFREIFTDLKQRGELTAGISQEFVNDLLTSGRCICGADLREGTHTHFHVKNLMKKAGSSTVEETAIRMSAQVDEIDKQALGFWEEADREQGRIQQLKENLDQVELELANIQEQLRKDPNEEISGLQKRLDEIEAKIDELNREQGANRQELSHLKAAIDALIKQISKQKQNEEKQSLAQRRINATQDAIERLSEVKNRQENQFRLQLEQRVQEIFSDISFTPYIPKISEKYELSLVENTTGIEAPVAASTGENQILSLSFIASIIDKVRDWSERRKMMMVPDSSTFPIVMDSPFGSLDANSRRHIARTIPKLANQLVVLVTKTQWRVEVEEEIADKIGKEYVLVYYSSKPNCEQDFIELGREKYSLVRQSLNGFEYTEIVEVE